ncbi:MAG: DUF4436 family protein [Acidobacteria bacterium]|nr:DUF4436 family protein [Acidobacteriota bacterium]
MSDRNFGRSFAGRFSVFFLAALTALSSLAFAQTESKPTDAANSENYIHVLGKVLSIDPIKGDVTVRLEFDAYGNFANEDGTLKKTLKFDTVSSNGKQEIVFEKGKRVSPTEVVLNMYDGVVEDYPFDTHKATLSFYFTVKPDKPAEKPKEANTEPEAKQETNEEEETEIEVPFKLDFAPSMPGYTITTEKSKESDATYLDLEMTIVRATMVKVFSVFVSLLMVLVTLAVVIFVITVVFKDRKVEMAMMSFIATLLFAFVAIRNSQPAVPPVGITADYIAFFWAEAVLALCLLTMIFTWILRPNK